MTSRHETDCDAGRHDFGSGNQCKRCSWVAPPVPDFLTRSHPPKALLDVALEKSRREVPDARDEVILNLRAEVARLQEALSHQIKVAAIADGYRRSAQAQRLVDQVARAEWFCRATDLEQVLQRLVPEGIENACGGDAEQCPSECAVRQARRLLENIG